MVRFMSACMLLAFGAVVQAGPEADLVVVNAKIWTVDRERPEAEAMAVIRDRIVAIGSSADILSWKGPKTRVVDAAGRLVLPGFYDSHVHMLGSGRRLAEVALKDCKDEEEFGRRLRDFDRKLPRDRWMVGGEWDHDRTFNGQLPTAELIDRYVSERPVFLRRYDGHMAVANSRALAQSGIGAQSRDPDGGVIFRKAGGKEPTGLLRDNAMDLVEKLIPPPSLDEIAEAILAALDEARRFGVTSVQDMDGSDATTRRLLFRTYQKMVQAGKLTCRIDLRWPLAAWKELADVGAMSNFGDEYVRLGGLKGFIDGSLGSSTAKMFEPFLNEKDSTGVFVTPPEKLREWIEAADKAGLSVAVHAIGDRANAELLDIFAEVAKVNGPRDRRFRIEHAQHLRQQDIQRFAELGVIASVQPYHIVDDGRWAEGRIGKARCASSYAMAGLHAAKARLAFGSDWSVAPLSPLLGIDAAVNRKTLDGKNPLGWYPEQKIGVETAIYAYTMGSAFAAGQEKDRGSLAVGKLADFVILDSNILKPEQAGSIDRTKIDATFVGGRQVFDRK